MTPQLAKRVSFGAALATAGVLAFGTNSAHANTACAVFGTLSNTSCTLSDGYTLTISNLTGGANQGLSTGSNFFGLASFGAATTGSFNWTISTTSPQFIKQVDFSLFVGTTSATATTPAIFNFDTNGQSYTSPDTSLTSISGTYIFSASPNNSGLTFTSDVPVPLPVVGAGLAFGFTRKLRKRAKAVA